MDPLDVRLKQLKPSFENFLSQSDLICDKILSFLNAKSLALLGATSHKLRTLTNTNHLWLFNFNFIFQNNKSI
jgi:hypothetical protein